MTKWTKLLSKDATRASVGPNGGGQVAADLNYFDWLELQPSAFQDQALGSARAKLFRCGGLTPERFSEVQLDENFKPLILNQMKKLKPLALEKLV